MRHFVLSLRRVQTTTLNKEGLPTEFLTPTVPTLWSKPLITQKTSDWLSDAIRVKRHDIVLYEHYEARRYIPVDCCTPHCDAGWLGTPIMAVFDTAGWEKRLLEVGADWLAPPQFSPDDISGWDGAAKIKTGDQRNLARDKENGSWRCHYQQFPIYCLPRALRRSI